jgi:hypothetical protein
MFIKGQKKELKSSSMWEMMLCWLKQFDPELSTEQMDVTVNTASIIYYSSLPCLSDDYSTSCLDSVKHRYTALQLVTTVLQDKPRYNGTINNEDPDYQMVKLISEFIPKWHELIDPDPNTSPTPSPFIEDMNKLKPSWGDMVFEILGSTSVNWAMLPTSYNLLLAKHVYYAIWNHEHCTMPCLYYEPVWELHLAIQHLFGNQFQWWNSISEKPEDRKVTATKTHSTTGVLLIPQNAETIKAYGKKEVQAGLDHFLQHNVTCITNANGELVLLPEFKSMLQTLLTVS